MEKLNTVSGVILRRVIRFAAALLISVPIVLASAELPVHACAFPMLGDGSSSNPWQVSTTDHLTCLVPPTIFIRTGGVYFILTTDLDWTSVDPITQPNMVSFDGDGHTITIKNRSNFVGLFGNPTGITVSNLTVHSVNSTLASDPTPAAPTLPSAAGWFASKDTDGTYTNVHSTGAIPQLGGGIVGSDSSGSTISNCTTSGAIATEGGGVVGAYARGSGSGASLRLVTVSGCTTTGSIGQYAGGVVGYNPMNVRVEKSVTTGTIGLGGGGIIGTGAQNDVEVTMSHSSGAIGEGGGGIIGSFAGFENNSVVSVQNVFSTGAISNGAGGIFGRDAGPFNNSYFTIADSFSTGTIGANGGGLTGANALSGTSSSMLFSNVFSTGATSGGYGITGIPVGAGVLYDRATGLVGVPWDDVQMLRIVSGAALPFGSKWGSCALNTPFFLTAFYPRNPCVDALATNVTVSSSGGSASLSASSVSRPASDQFSLTSTLTSSPLSHVAVVNGTGSVSLDGVACTASTSCIMPDVTQGPSSRAQFTITGNGTVSVKRFDVFTRTTSDIGSLSVEKTPGPIVPVSSVTLTLDANGGSCQASSLSGAVGSSVALPVSGACTRSGKSFSGWNTDPSGKGTSYSLGASIRLDGNVTLFAQWSELAAPKAMASTAISASIARLSRTPGWVKVTGRLLGVPRPRGIEVWFRERGSVAFVKSGAPVLRNGNRITWFHYSSKPVEVYVTANGGIRSRTLRVPSAPTQE